MVRVFGDGPTEWSDELLGGVLAAPDPLAVIRRHVQSIVSTAAA